MTYHHALTTTVRDSAALLDAVAGHHPGDSFGAPTPLRPFLEEVGADAGRLRIGLIRIAPGPFPTDAACTAAVDHAAALLRDLGHEVREVHLGLDMMEVLAAGGTIMAAETQAQINDRLAALGRGLAEDDIEPWTRATLDSAANNRASDLAKALQTAQRTGWRVAEQFGPGGVDVILLPTRAQTTPKLGYLDVKDPETMGPRTSRFAVCTNMFNLSGQPAISLPIGTDDNGMPVGVQLMADLAREDLLLRLAGQLEASAPWQRVATGYQGW